MVVILIHFLKPLSYLSIYIIPKIFKKIKLKRDNVDNEYTANSVHYEIGKIVRKAIKKAGGTMPEDLTTPERSLKEIEVVKLQK